MKSEFAKGLPIFGMQRVRWLKESKGTISKEMTWLKGNMHVNKMDLKKTKLVKVPLGWLLNLRRGG